MGAIIGLICGIATATGIGAVAVKALRNTVGPDAPADKAQWLDFTTFTAKTGIAVTVLWGAEPELISAAAEQLAANPGPVAIAGGVLATAMTGAIGWVAGHTIVGAGRELVMRPDPASRSELTARHDRAVADYLAAGDDDEETLALVEAARDARDGGSDSEYMTAVEALEAASSSAWASGESSVVAVLARHQIDREVVALAADGRRLTVCTCGRVVEGSIEAHRARFAVDAATGRTLR